MTTANATPVHTTVVGVFDDMARARAALDDLRVGGFTDEQVGYVAPGPRPRVGDGQNTQWEEGAEVGAALGATAGGAAGVAAAVSLLTPAGPAVIGGALATWLATLGAGTAAGGLLGALVGLGFPEDHGRWYESEVQAGRTIVTIHDADERAEDAREILRKHGATIREPSLVGTYGTGLPATPF